MTYVLYPFRTTERTTLDTTTPFASESAAERTARHLAMCQELAELGMQMARAAARQAVCAAESAATTPPRPKRQNPSLAFARISREIRQIITLENRLAAPATAAATRGPRASPRQPRERPEPDEPIKIPAALAAEMANPDNRRAVICSVVKQITELHPSRDEIRDRFEKEADSRLAADPNYKIPAGEILIDIADSIGLDIEGAEITVAIYDELIPHRFRAQAPEQPAFIPPVTPRGTDPPRMVA